MQLQSNNLPHITQSQTDALATLYDRGARFVLCKPNKSPLWRRWQKRRPDWPTVKLHAQDGDLLGLIPFSIRSTGLDIDRGDPAELFGLYPPRVAVPSRRRGGLHGYYADREGRKNGRFELAGCSGEVRGSRGYLILHGEAAQRIARADFEGEDLPGWFPANLWEAAGVALPKLASAPYQPSAEAAGVWSAKAAEALDGLSAVLPGVRNNSLFNAIRFYAYGQHNRPNIEHWRAHITDYALNANARLSEPLGSLEVLRTAWSVASWCWNGGGPMDHSPAAQRRRGKKSGKVRRAKVKPRDRRILELSAEGKKQREIAEAMGISLGAVNYVLKRDRDQNLFNEPASSLNPKPGDLFNEPNQLGAEGSEVETKQLEALAALARSGWRTLSDGEGAELEAAPEATDVDVLAFHLRELRAGVFVPGPEFYDVAADLKKRGIEVFVPAPETQISPNEPNQLGEGGGDLFGDRPGDSGRTDARLLGY